MRIARVIAIVAVVLMVAGLVLGTGCDGRGPKGDTGATGATGAQGPKGDTGAQGPPGEIYSLFVNPIVYAGSNPAIYGAGFTPGDSVYLVFDCRMHTGAAYNWTATATVNEWGAFRTEIPIPTGIDAGVYTITASVTGVVVANAALRFP